jgi:hypothetical protein
MVRFRNLGIRKFFVLRTGRGLDFFVSVLSLGNKRSC